MKIKEYIEESASTAIYPYRGQYGGLTYVICGLAGETGECFEVLKKIMRDNDGIINDNSRIKSEVGDILWYWSQLLFETYSEFKDEDNPDADEFQEKIYKSYLGEFPAPEKSIYLQIRILAKNHEVITKLFKEYEKIVETEDFKKTAPILSGLAMEYFKIICVFLSTLDIKISEVMQMNLDKLADRKEEGALQGSGENVDERKE